MAEQILTDEQKQEALINDFIANRDSSNLKEPVSVPQDDFYSPTWDTTNDNVIGDVGRGIARGPFVALKNSAMTLAGWFGIEGTAKEIAPFATSVLNAIDEPTTTAGQVAQTGSAFMSSYLTLRGVGGNSFKAATVKGGVVDSLIWDAKDPRISDLLSEAGIQNVVVDYLKHDINDSKMEDSFKNVIEGALSGIASEAVVRTIVQGYRTGKALLWKDKSIEDVTAIVDGKHMDEVVQPVAAKEEVPMQPEVKPIEDVMPTVKVEDAMAPTEVKGTKPPETAFNYDRMQLDSDSQAVLENIVNTQDFETYFKTGVKPQVVTKKQAAEFDKIVGGDYLGFAKQLVKDTKDMDAKLVYLQQKLTDKITEFTQFAKNTNPNNLTDIVKMAKAMQELTILTGGVKGPATSAARTTAAGRINKIPGEILNSLDELSQLEPDLLEKEMGKFIDAATATKIHKKALEIIDIEKNVSLHQGVQDLSKVDGPLTKFFKAAVELRSAGLLSGPVTLGINIAGNTIVRSLARVEDLLAYGIGATFRTEDRLLWDEFSAMSNGRFTSMLETFTSIGNSIKKGGWSPRNIEDSLDSSYLDFYQKYDSGTNKAFSGEYLFNINDKSNIIAKGAGHLIDVVGATTRLPFHALGITDDMFKRSIYNGQISYIGTREANKLGLKGAAKDKYISEFIYAHKLVFAKKAGSKLTDEQKILVKKYIFDNKGAHHLEAIERARELTFQEEIRSGAGASRIDKALTYIDRLRNLHPLGEFLVPFYRTPVNLVKWTARRTPLLNLVSKRMRDDFMAGGRRRNLALARTFMGTSLFALGGFLASEKLLIGGSKDESQRKSRVTEGVQDYSIIINGKTIPVNRFDPVVMPLFMAADLYAIHNDMIQRGYNTIDGYQEHWDEVANAIMLSFTNNVLNKTWLKSVSDLTNAIKYGNEQYAYQALASFAPYSSLSKFTQQTDTYKEAKGLLENFQKMYNPYILRDSLDVFGKATEKKTVVGLPYSELSKSISRQEIFRLKVPVTKFSNKIEANGTSIELTPEDHWKMQSYVNDKIHLEETLNAVMSTPEYKNAPDGSTDFTVKGTKRYMIREAISEARVKAKEYFLSTHPNVVEEYQKKLKANIGTLSNKNKTLEELILQQNK